MSMKKKEQKSKKLKVFNEQEIEEVAQLSIGATTKQIAAYFGIADKTFYDIRKRQSEVNAAYQKGKVRALAAVTGKLMKLIDEGNVTATIFYLKTRGGWKEAKHTDTPEDQEDDIYNDSSESSNQKKIVIEFIEPKPRNEDLKEVTPVDDIK